MNSVQWAAEVDRRGDCVDHTGIVANQTDVALTGRKQDTVISATDVLKARDLMYINFVPSTERLFEIWYSYPEDGGRNDTETLVHI